MRKGFTLAEVLITLTIIGVIAALTIPNLMQEYKKHEVEVKLKETYSLLSNALTLAKTEHSFSVMGELAQDTKNNAVGSDMRTARADYFAENYIKPYLKAKVHCPTMTRTNKTCTYNIIGLDNSNISGGYIGLLVYMSRFILDNGTLVAAASYPNSGATTVLLVDINASKGPNTLGKDVFYFGLHTPLHAHASSIYHNNGNRIFATGINSYEQDEKTLTCNNAGWSCIAPIFRNGWKIPDDYPVKKW